MHSFEYALPMMISMTRLNRSAAALLAVALVAAAPGAGCRNTTVQRPQVALGMTAGPQWAASLEEPGLPNLHKVSDDLYRGAQPSDAGFERLAAMGVRTVVNARKGDDDLAVLRAAGLEYEFIPMSAFDPRDEDVIRFLRIAGDPRRGPVFVHCQHGADRTGFLCAMYRVAVQGWSRQEAVEEMTRGGMGFISICTDLIRYVKEADVEKLRRLAGIQPADSANLRSARARDPLTESASWRKY